MLLSEMSVQEVVMDCASNLLHFSVDHRSEYDPDVVFDKNTIFSAFCSTADKKECLKIK